MAKNIFIIMSLVFILALAGCNKSNTGKSQIITSDAKIVEGAYSSAAADAAEVDLVEQMAENRAKYRQSLNILIDYYYKSGNNMKLQWAKKELQQFDEKIQYNYITEASFAGGELKAADSIEEADKLYDEALELDKKASNLLVLKDNDELRVALKKYNKLIKTYPTSDKIDDAAYKSAIIYQHFKDYEIAVLYYQRTYQWDQQTKYPAKYKAAYILDYYLNRRDQALLLYQDAAKDKNISSVYRDYADTRAKELMKVIIPEN